MSQERRRKAPFLFPGADARLGQARGPRRAGFSSQCSFTLGLPDGQILIQAAYGPGFNTGARGQGRDRELSNSKLAFHLELIQ
jgi:hypothetical protein